MTPKRIFSLILSFAMITVCLQAPAVSATDSSSETYSISELIGNTGMMWRQDDYNTETVYSASNPLNSAGIADGSPLGDEGDAVEIRYNLTVPTMSDKMYVQIGDNDANRVFMCIHGTNAWFNPSGVHTNGTLSELKDGWVNMLIVNKGDYFALHYSTDEGVTYSGQVFDVSSKMSNNNSVRNNIYVYFEGSAECSVEYIKYYTPGYEASALVGEERSIRYIDYGKNFSSITPLPLGSEGDAVEMRFNLTINESSGFGQIIIPDADGNRVFMRLTKTGGVFYYGGEPSYPSVPIPVNLANRWVTILIVNRGTGFDLHYKYGDETYFSPVCISTTGKRDGTRTNIELSSSNADFEVEYTYYYGNVETFSLEELIGTNMEVRYTDTGSSFGVLNPVGMGDEGGAVEMRFKATINNLATNDSYVDITIPDGDGKRVYMRIHKTGAWVGGGDVATENLNDPNNLKNQWVTMLFINKGDHYAIYYKLDNDVGFRTCLVTTGKRDANGWTKANVAPTNASCEVEYTKYYGEKVRYSLEQLLGTDMDMRYETTGRTFPALDPAPLGYAGDAVEMRIKVTLSSPTDSVHLQVPDAEGNRVYVVINQNGGAFSDGSGNDGLGGVSIPKGILTDKWVTLLFINRGTGFDLHYKLDEDEGFRPALVSTSGKRAGNGQTCISVSADTDTAQTDISYTKYHENIYKPLLTDANVISAEKHEIFIDEDFSAADNSLISLNNTQISGGLLNGSKLASGTSGEAKIALDRFDLSGEWKVRMRLKIDESHAVVPFVVDGKRLYCKIMPGGIFMLAGDTDGDGADNDVYVSNIATQGEWYDYLFCFNGTESVNIYIKKADLERWKTVARGVPLRNSTENESIRFIADSTCAWSLDSIQLYKGALASLTAPVVSGNTISGSGSISLGSRDADYNRRASVITAAYDNEYGFTSFVGEKCFDIIAGTDVVLDYEIDTGAVDMTKNTAAVMLWDSFDTAVSLADSQGDYLANSAEGRPTDGQSVGLTTKAQYNEVYISGYLGSEGILTAVLVDSYGVVRAAGQTTSNIYGLVDTMLAVDPACASGPYTLRLYHGNQVATDTPVTLNCADKLLSEPITDADSFETFLNSYGTDGEKSLLAGENFAEEAYARYIGITNSATMTDLYKFRKAVAQAFADENDERVMVTVANTAVAEQKWSQMETLVLTTYKDYLAKCAEELGLEMSSISGISSTKELFGRMLVVDTPYTDTVSVINAFNAAVVAQKAAENDAGNNSNESPGTDGIGSYGGGGGGGGGGAGGSTAVLGSNDDLPLLKPAEPTGAIVKFTDLGSVEWAEESILELQKLGILAGDGSGNFYPNRNITREEFLKLVMEALEISTNATEALSFKDVKSDEWYFKYISSAYKLGIVNGTNDTEFGIGSNITRADMAVILKRAMDYCGVKIENTIPAFVFDDFADIPVYARTSITALSEAELIQGVGGNRFNPAAQAIRAEAATLIYRIYNYTGERR